MALISNLKDTSSNMNLVIITSEQFPLYDVTFGIRRNPLSTDSDQEKLKKNLRSKIAFSWNSFSVRNTIKSLCISPTALELVSDYLRRQKICLQVLRGSFPGSIFSRVVTENSLIRDHSQMADYHCGRSNFNGVRHLGAAK